MRTINAALMTAATAVLATGVGLGTAYATPAGPAKAGTEHFYLMSTSNGPKASIIVTGVFTATGVDISGNSADTVRLPGGTFKILHPSDIPGKSTLNKATCFTTYTGSSAITLGKGTGKYKGISGSGKATLSFIGILKRVNGTCSENATPVVTHEVINATANVRP